MSKVHILLAGGGTGGHIYPLVAVAQRLKAQIATAGAEVDLRYFGEAGTYEKLLKEQGIKIVSIASSKLRRYASVLNFLDFFKFIWGFIQAMIKIYFFMPEVMFSKSGPGVLPIVYAARWYRIPLVIHETDAVPGLTSIASSKHAQIVELAFENAREYFSKKKIINVVGNPVRESLVSTESAAACRSALGLSDSKPILLFIGGSQGSERINYFVLEHGEELFASYEVIHQTGVEKYEQYKGEFEFVSKNWRPELKQNYFLYPYLDDQTFTRALTAADLVISRSGGSIFEIAAAGKPAILIPLSSSANNHQFENAYAYAQAGAGIVLEEGNLLPGIFTTQVEKILQNKEVYAKMSAGAKAFYKPQAADLIAKDILAIAKT